VLDNGAEDGNGGDAEAAGGAPGVNVSAILGLVEAQINTIGNAAATSDASNGKSAQPGQQAGASATPPEHF